MVGDEGSIGPRVRAAWATGARLAAHREMEAQFRLARRRTMTPDAITAEYDRVGHALADEDRISSHVELTTGYP